MHKSTKLRTAIKHLRPKSTNNNINQLIAERNGYDQSALIRSRLENQLPSPNPPQPVPQPAPTPPLPPPDFSVSEVSLPTRKGEEDKLAITVQTFIPFKRADGLNNPIYHPFEPAIDNFEGDNRDLGGVNKESGKESFRTQQRILIDFNMPENIEIPCNQVLNVWRIKILEEVEIIPDGMMKQL